MVILGPKKDIDALSRAGLLSYNDLYIFAGSPLNDCVASLRIKCYMQDVIPKTLTFYGYRLQAFTPPVDG